MSDEPNSAAATDVPADGELAPHPDGERSGKVRVAPFAVLAITVIIAGLFWLLIGAKTDNTESSYTPLLDKPAPSVETTTFDGNAFNLQRRKGSWVVLNFFNATCVPCVQEHPELVKFNELQSSLGTSGAELYTVAWDDSGNKVRSFFSQNDGTWTVLSDDDASIAVAFGVAKVPETWVIDPDGTIVFHTISEVTADSLSRVMSGLRAKYELGQT